MSDQIGPNGTQRDLGKLEARQEVTESRLAKIELDIGQILLYVTTIKGLIHVLIALGTVATFIAAVIEIVRAFK